MFAKVAGPDHDGIHSLSDLVADFVVLVTNRAKAQGPTGPSPTVTTALNAASLVLGGLLLAVGVGMLWSAFRKLESPDNVPQVLSSPGLDRRRRCW